MEIQSQDDAKAAAAMTRSSKSPVSTTCKRLCKAFSWRRGSSSGLNTSSVSGMKPKELHLKTRYPVAPSHWKAPSKRKIDVENSGQRICKMSKTEHWQSLHKLAHVCLVNSIACLNCKSQPCKRRPSHSLEKSYINTSEGKPVTSICMRSQVGHKNLTMPPMSASWALPCSSIRVSDCNK